MNKKELNQWTAEKRNMEKIFYGISGLSVRVEDAYVDAIGYTSADGAIHLSYENELTKFAKNKASAIRLGVGFHELLHKMKTNFELTERTCRTLPRYEAEIFHMIDNSLEDAAIEEYAYEVAGGYVLDSLNFAIAKTYEMTSYLHDIEDGFGQFSAALIMFGDMGALKGHFTDMKARDIFKKCAPIFYKGLRSKDTVVRNKCSFEIFKLSEPLWRPIVDEAKSTEEKIRKLKELLKKLGVNPNFGTGSGEDAEEESGEGSGSKRDERRRNTLTIISEEEKEELMKQMSDSSEGDGSGKGASKSLLTDEEGDGKGSGNTEGTEILATEEDLKKLVSKKDKSESSDGLGISGSPDKENKEDKENNEKSSGGSSTDNKDTEENKNSSGSGKEDESTDSSEKGTKSKSSKGEGEDGKGNDSKGNPKSKDNKSENKSSNESSSENGTTDETSKTDGKRMYDKNGSEKTVGSFEDADTTEEREECSFSEEELNSIRADVQRMLETDELDDEDDVDDHGVKDYNIEIPSLPKIGCKNQIMKSDMSSFKPEYEQVCNKFKKDIRSLVNQLRSIFQNDQEEKVYRRSGKLDVDRFYGGRITSRVFDKTKEPDDKSDFGVFLLIDQSGSMGSNKMNMAKQSAIVLAEAFEQMNVPIYIMGFTTTYGETPLHQHYVRWNRKKKDKYSLIGMRAQSNNFDGYAIRYANKILKEKNYLHKLLIVISDGQPACGYYRGADGIADTKMAIREAKKTAEVIGVLIGNSDVNQLHYMYGNDFFHISKMDELCPLLIKRIIKQLNE